MPAQLRIPAKRGRAESVAIVNIEQRCIGNAESRLAIASRPFQKLDARASVNYSDINSGVDNIDRCTAKE